MKKITLLLTGILLIALIPLISSCNNEDDVVEIFTGKTWKMSRLTDHGKNPPQFYQGIWKTENEKMRSMELLNKEGNFQVTFEGSEVNGEVNGTQVKIQGVGSTATGTWQANGKDNTVRIQIKNVRGTETDPLAKAFMAAIRKVFSYEGDINQLTLFYQEDNQITRKIGFVKQ